MLDYDLADREAAGGGKDGDEAVQFSIKPHFAENLGTVPLHPAIVIVQAHTGDRAHEGVKNPAGPNLVPGIVANSLPTTHDIEPAAQLGDEGWDFLGIILQIGVHGKDEIAPRRMHAGRQSGRLAEVSP